MKRINKEEFENEQRRVLNEMGNEKHLSTIPIYVIDLNKPPKERWTELINDYKQEMVPMFQKLKEEEKIFPWIIRFILRIIIQFFWRFFINKEIQKEVDSISNIVKSVGIPKIEVIMLNIGYDILARCTSIIIQHPKGGNVVHFRTMDWDSEEIRAVTVQLIFIKDNQIVAKVTSWPGFVGFFTAEKIGEVMKEKERFSISINYRKSEGGDWQYISNFYNMMIGSAPLSLSIRHSILNLSNYSEAVEYLSKVRLVSPCYIIIAGSNRDEGIILTRNRRTTKKKIYLAQKNYLIQTNIDHWINHVNPYWAADDLLLQNSVERRDIAIHFIQSLFDDENEKKSFGNFIYPSLAFELLLKTPIYNAETIYGTYMEPSADDQLNYYNYSFAKL